MQAWGRTLRSTCSTCCTEAGPRSQRHPPGRRTSRPPGQSARTRHACCGTRIYCLLFAQRRLGCLTAPAASTCRVQSISITYTASFLTCRSQSRVWTSSFRRAVRVMVWQAPERGAGAPGHLLPAWTAWLVAHHGPSAGTIITKGGVLRDR